MVVDIAVRATTGTLASGIVEWATTGTFVTDFAG